MSTTVLSDLADEEVSFEDDENEEEEEEDMGGAYPLDEGEEPLGEEEEELPPPWVLRRRLLDTPRDLPEPIDLTAELIEEATDNLGVIKLCWPTAPLSPTALPLSYRQNDDKEQVLLLYAENFRRQFVEKYPHRKPLFLAAQNECTIKKMVCTTIRPTCLPYGECDDWRKLSKFFGNFFVYQPLQIPTQLPHSCHSPTSVVQRQFGHCFELSTVICSLLLGLGYDVYVVSGYAKFDITQRVRKRFDAPWRNPTEPDDTEPLTEPPNKYEMQTKRFTSRFLEMMAQREIDKVKMEKQRLADEQHRLETIAETPPPDPLEGQRVHSWLLIKPANSANREVDTPPHYIEPSTGMIFDTDNALYCGVESVWNHQNYWVNMQMAVPTVTFDFDNCDNWEHFLVGEPYQWRHTATTLDMEEEEINLIQIMEEKHLDMPILSWSEPIVVPPKVFYELYPGGTNTTWYRKTLVEEYAPYIRNDGLVRMITRYSDIECTKHVSTEYYFENRENKMTKVLYDVESDSTTEFYDKGRPDNVIKHFFTNNFRVLEFDWAARTDCLEKLEIADDTMTEHYNDSRDDRLKTCNTYYARPGAPPPGMVEGVKRLIIRIVEYYNRDSSRVDDIARLEFAFVQRQFHIKYQHADGKVTASTRTFTKPRVAELSDDLRFDPEMTTSYEADTNAPPPRQLDLFRLFKRLLNAEIETVSRIRRTEDMIADFLAVHQNQLDNPTLLVSIYDQVRTDDMRTEMLERGKQVPGSKDHETAMEMDYLASYLVEMGCPAELSIEQATRLREQFLEDYKRMLLNRAHVIQKQYEQESTNLQQLHTWYKRNQSQLSGDEERRYIEKEAELNFLLQSYESRLVRHRDQSNSRYMDMVRFVDRHPKMQVLLHQKNPKAKH